MGSVDKAVSFRNYIPTPTWPRTKTLPTSTALEWCEEKRGIPELAWFIDRLDRKTSPPQFIGFTNNGSILEDVFQYASDEGAPTEAMCKAAESLLLALTEKQQQEAIFDSIEVDDFRIWSNPELYINPGGLRLDECSPQVQDLVHVLLRESLSPSGYNKVLGCCLTNEFLGQLLHGEAVLNKHSYNFRLFGKPDIDRPWGFSFFGHHVCLAVVVQGKRMVIGPTFLGAEPDHIDEGPHAGLRLFQSEESLGLRLMRMLPVDLQKKATLSTSMDPKNLPADRWNPYDERHLGGARQDNRIVPYEGCRASDMTQEQQELLYRLFSSFNEYCPERVLAHRLEQFKSRIADAHFAWIGAIGDDEPYYYRIHSPVAFMEFDFHCGVFLANDTPAKFHIHTINRLPNGGDYGRALVRQYQHSQTLHSL